MGLGWGVAARTSPTQRRTVLPVANNHTSLEGTRLSAARRTRDETKELMIEAGREVLLRDGIGVGASTFRYRDAFEHLAKQGIKVTRGSVHERIWSSQLAWQLDVLSEVIRRNDEHRRLAVADAITAALIDLPIDTEAQRQLVMAEAARIGCLVFMDEVERKPDYRLLPTLVAAWKASTDDLPEHERLGHILHETQSIATDRFRDEVRLLVDHLDLRPHPDLGLDLDEAIRAYGAASTALAYSHTIRLGDDPRLTDTIMARCPDGEQREWNLLGLGNWIVSKKLLVDREWVGS